MLYYSMVLVVLYWRVVGNACAVPDTADALPAALRAARPSHSFLPAQSLTNSEPVRGGCRRPFRRLRG